MNHLKWRYNPSIDRIYHLSESGRWRYYRQAYNRDTRYKRYIADEWVRQEEAEAAPFIPSIQVLSHQYCTMSQYGEVSTCIPIAPTYANYTDELLNSPRFGWAFATIKFMVPLSTIADYIRHNLAEFATDGSSDEGKSTSGFIMFIDEDDLLEGGNYVPGRECDQNSFRGEGAGLLAVTLLLEYICDRFNITSGIVTIYCDSSSALKKAFGYDLISSAEPSNDIYKRIRTSIAACPLQIKGQWIKGHQDRKTPYTDLDAAGKANCRVDKVAGEFMKQHPGNSNIEKHFPPTNWEVSINGEAIYSGLKNTLYHHCTAPAIRKYWAEKHYFANKPIGGIDWNAFESAAGRAPSKQQTVPTRTDNESCIVVGY